MQYVDGQICICTNHYAIRAQLIHLCRLGLTGYVLCHNDLIVHDVLFSRADCKGHGQHRTLIADLADDISHIGSFASQDSLLSLNADEYNSMYLSFVT